MFFYFQIYIYFFGKQKMGPLWLYYTPRQGAEQIFHRPCEGANPH